MAKNIGFQQNELYIGSMSFPDRKKPYFDIQPLNKVHLIGTFNNQMCVDAFADAVHEMFDGWFSTEVENVKT